MDPTEGAAPLAIAANYRQHVNDLTGQALRRAERALRGCALRELERIERTVRSPTPLVDRGPTAAQDRGCMDRFLWASARTLGFARGGLLVLSGREYASLFRGDSTARGTCLHFCLGEGPAIDALDSGTVIEVDDFRLTTSRWPAFSQAIADLGIRSALYIPLTATQPGLVLAYWHNIKRVREPPTRDWTTGYLPQSVSPERIRTIAETLFKEKSGAITSQELLSHIDATVAESATIYQAAGFLSARLAITTPTALNLLRLQAWADRRPLPALCEELLSNT